MQEDEFDTEILQGSWEYCVYAVLQGRVHLDSSSPAYIVPAYAMISAFLLNNFEESFLQ